MGFLSWWRGKRGTAATGGAAAAVSNPEPSAPPTGNAAAMNGAVEVRRPSDVTVFEFGSAMASGDGVTLAGYCPVSDELEPCRWEILPATGSVAPQFRVLF
ncbi:uncharacterized protein [Elaeis guineensis]|uniref:Uncharacterized protein LOC109505712 n=1 Tax=Elaeis guineensis var. tenera TaxID=51953 RepID=A0A6J0PG98_ELAGV|nr:uncharacterized protein LOC109505712 [Elaeis guineensis]